MRHARSTAVAAICLIAAAVAGCGGSDSSSGTSGASNASSGAGKTLKILVSAPLSGDYAETGNNMVHGAELGAEYVNAHGGVADGPEKGAQLEVAGLDDKLSTQGALAVASKYVQDADAWLLMGYLDSSLVQAAAQVAGRQKLALISSQACADFLVKLTNVAVQCPHLTGFGQVGVDFAKERFDVKRIAVITTTESFAPDYLTGVTKQAKADGITISTIQRYKVGSTTDFSALVQNMKASNPDAVINLAYQADAGRILATMRANSFDVPFVDGFTEGWGATFFAAAGAAATQGEGAFGQYPGQLFLTSGLGKEINAQYKAKYGKNLPAPAQYMFDSVLSGASAIAAGAGARDQVADHFADVSGDGITRPLGYGTDRRVESAYVTMAQVTGTKPTDLKLAALYKITDTSVTKTK